MQINEVLTENIICNLNISSRAYLYNRRKNFYHIELFR